MLQNMSFITLHSVINSQWKGKLKKKPQIFAFLIFDTQFWQQIYPFIPTSGSWWSPLTFVAQVVKAFIVLAPAFVSHYPEKLTHELQQEGDCTLQISEEGKYTTKWEVFCLYQKLNSFCPALASFQLHSDKHSNDS